MGRDEARRRRALALVLPHVAELEADRRVRERRVQRDRRLHRHREEQVAVARGLGEVHAAADAAIRRRERNRADGGAGQLRNPAEEGGPRGSNVCGKYEQHSAV